jgi:hypothetical protein
MNEWDMDHTGRTSFGESDMTQPEALRLADDLQRRFPKSGKDAAAELRRLHEVNQELLAALKEALDVCIWPGSVISDVHSKARAAIAKGEAK